MNWGKGLTIFIVLFILSMLGMVYISFKQSNEMLEDNYYDREIKYQEVIDAKSNFIPFKSELKTENQKDTFFVVLPPEISDKITIGKLQLIKMDNAKMDKEINFSHSRIAILKTDLKLGSFHYKINWENNGKPYFYEDDISID